MVRCDVVFILHIAINEYVPVLYCWLILRSLNQLSFLFAWSDAVLRSFFFPRISFFLGFVAEHSVVLKTSL